MTINSRQLDEVRARLADVSVGTVVYVLQKAGFFRCFLPVPPVTPANTRFVGRARTLRTVPVREDLLAQRRAQPKSEDPHRIAIEEITAGEVLVIAARGNRDGGVMGDLLAQRIQTCGGAAVVTDGCVRDLPAIRGVGLPIFANGAHAGTFQTQHIAVEVNVPVDCGGTLVMPGDVMVGDDEGVAVIPESVVDEIVDDCLAQEQLDDFLLGRIRDGVPLSEAYPPNERIKAEYQRHKEATGL